MSKNNYFNRALESIVLNYLDGDCAMPEDQLTEYLTSDRVIAVVAHTIDVGEEALRDAVVIAAKEHAKTFQSSMTYSD